MYSFRAFYLVVVLIAHSVLANTQGKTDLPCALGLYPKQHQLNIRLMRAILDSNYRAVRSLIRNKADPNVWMPLSEFGFSNGVKFLDINHDIAIIDLKALIFSNRLVSITQGAEAEEILITPLHLAVRMGHSHIVSLLLEDFKVKDTPAGLGVTAFSLLAYQGHVDDADMQLMVQSFIQSQPEPAEMEIGMAFHNAVIKGNMVMARAILKSAPQSKIIKGFRYKIRFHFIDWITRSKKERSIKRLYRAVFRHLDAETRT